MKAKPITTVISASALALLLSGPAYTAEQGGQAQTGTEAGAMAQQAPDLQREFLANKLMGMKVKNREDKDLGEIANLIIDPSDGTVSHVVLERGGIAGVGSEKYVVPYDRIELNKAEEVAIIDVPEDQVSAEFAAFEEEPAKKEEKKEQESTGGEEGKME